MMHRAKSGTRGNADFCQFLVRLSRDKETGQVIAEEPTLELADYGLDSNEAITRLHKMVAFHLKCLAMEGKIIPSESDPQEGLFLRVKLPTDAP